MNGILRRWHEKGLHTVGKAIQAGDGLRQNRGGAPGPGAGLPSRRGAPGCGRTWSGCAA